MSYRQQIPFRQIRLIVVLKAAYCGKLIMAFKIMFLGYVIGRRGIDYTDSSLWPCQKHYLKHYILGYSYSKYG